MLIPAAGAKSIASRRVHRTRRNRRGQSRLRCGRAVGPKDVGL